jgi:hypothetical protein
MSVPSSLREFVHPLDIGASKAIESNQPVRLWYADNYHLAEVFFFRDMVLHAELDGIVGIDAMRALLQSDVRFAVELGAWPRQCTITRPWATTRTDAVDERRPSPVDYQSDEATARIVEVR